mgnify:CR=1 FL=1
MLPTPPSTPKTPTKSGTSRGNKVVDAVVSEFSSSFDAYTLEAYRELFSEYDDDVSFCPKLDPMLTLNNQSTYHSSFVLFFSFFSFHI